MSQESVFGCYTLFTHPETFNRYVIGSPSLSWRDAELFTRAEQYTKAHRDLVANVFIGVGALEDGPDNPTMRNVRRLESLLLAQKYPSLKLSVRVFQDETHLTVWPQNLIRGLVSLFGRPAPEDTLLAKYRALVAATQNGR